jgi:hypothetical protein
MVSPGHEDHKDHDEMVACVGSGGIPEIFEDLIEGTRFGACPICGKIVPFGGLVEEH